MKKLIYITTIILLLISMASCYTNKTLTSQEEYYSCMKKKHDTFIVNENNVVIYVLTKQGDSIVFFNRFHPARVSDSGVYGLQQVDLLIGAVDSVAFGRSALHPSAKSLHFLWKDGIRYEFISQNSTGYVCFMSDIFNIPLSEIDEIQIRQKSVKKMIPVFVAVGISAVIVIIFAVGNLDMSI